MNVPYDHFPSNLCESMGKIERKPIRYRYSKVEVWQGGNVIFTSTDPGLVNCELQGSNLSVSLDAPKLSPYVNLKFMFGEISTNMDRIMWSKDLFDTRDSTEKNVPNIMSLFYQGSILTKMTFTVHDPNVLLELHK
jgi:hypothetical protein